ncbi:MAG: ABC transporter permease [Chloroflexi bacterium]|nr:ABC transporter permease [Chloroflexota bacterium]
MPGLVARVPAGAKALCHFARRKPLGALGLLGFVVLSAAAALAPLLATHPPDLNDVTALVRPPSWQHWFGTDAFGRDVFSRVVYGARISLAVGLGATALGSLVGAILGLVSGYAGHQVDALLQRLVDVLLAVPPLVLAMALAVALRPSLGTLVIAIAVPVVPRMARVLRASTLAALGHAYVEAAVACGNPPWRIVLVHIAPNVVSPFIVMASGTVGTAILAEASLSFLGLGVPPPAATWGQMLSGQAMRLFETAPWVALFPGLAISLAVFSVNLLGDAVRDVLDPKQRGV